MNILHGNNSILFDVLTFTDILNKQTRLASLSNIRRVYIYKWKVKISMLSYLNQVKKQL